MKKTLAGFNFVCVFFCSLIKKKKRGQTFFFNLFSEKQICHFSCFWFEFDTFLFEYFPMAHLFDIILINTKQIDSKLFSGLGLVASTVSVATVCAATAGVAKYSYQTNKV